MAMIRGSQPREAGFNSLIGYYINMVAVVQMVEHWIVVPVVVGSSPIGHPYMWA